MRSKVGHWVNKRVLVVGLGISGQSAARLLLKNGALVCGVDKRYATLKDDPAIQTLMSEGLSVASEVGVTPAAFQLVVVSPGVPPTHSIYQEAFRQHVPLIGEIELAMWMAPSHWRFLGVTGTNGKTTVTSLVAHVLNANGIKALAVGNIGTPLTEELLEPSETPPVYVVELSSYQIETMHGRSLDAALILNISPDHLDRYGSMELYALAKMRLGRTLKRPEHFYVQSEAYRNYGHLIPSGIMEPQTFGNQPEDKLFADLQSGQWSWHGEKLDPLFSASSRRELENLMGAFLLCRTCGITLDQFCTGSKSFFKPSHRIEYVAEVAGTKFYDDSKGTNIDAVIHAVETLSGPIVLIVGGVDKGGGYEAWIEPFKTKVKALVGIGQASGLIEEALKPHFKYKKCTTFEEAVHSAFALANSEATVLLSPGCASQDMFRDYKHRGDEFKKIVYSLVSARE